MAVLLHLLISMHPLASMESLSQEQSVLQIVIYLFVVKNVKNAFPIDELYGFCIVDGANVQQVI